MADFTNNKIKNTYQRLVQVDASQLQDGLGNPLTGSMGNLTVSGSLNITGFSNVSASLASLESFSSSIDTGYATDADLRAYTASADARLAALELETGSITTEQATQDARLSTLETETGSINTRLSTLETETGSITTEQATQDARLGAIEIKTGSYAVTASNTFIGNQTITGSLNISGSQVMFHSSSFLVKNENQVALSVNRVTLPNGEQFGGFDRISMQAYAQYPFSSSLYGSSSLANVSVAHAGAGYTQTLLYGDNIQLGVFNSKVIEVGNANETLKIRAGSGQLSGSYSHTGSFEFRNGLEVTGSFKQDGDCYMVPGTITAFAGGSTFLTGSAFQKNIIKVNYSGSNGTHTVTLPDCTNLENTHRCIRFISDSTTSAVHIVDIAASGSQTIDGGASYTINRAYEGVMFWSDGVEWYRIQSKA